MAEKKSKPKTEEKSKASRPAPIPHPNSYLVGTLRDWLLAKHRRYFHRQGRLEFYSELAQRLIAIMHNEPEHKIAKILKGREENA